MTDAECVVANFHRYFKVIRSVYGLSSEELGNAMGLTRQTIINYEYSYCKTHNTLFYYAFTHYFLELNIQTADKTMEFLLNPQVSNEDKNNLETIIITEMNKFGRRVGSRNIGELIRNMIEEQNLLMEV